MPNLKILLLGIVLAVAPRLLAQDTVTINFDAEYHFMKTQGVGFMKLIDNHNDQFYYRGREYKITFPDHFFVGDTAIAFNYFTGWENPTVDKTTAFLFGNYKSYTPIVYVDYNHNLDFSDDGQPLKFNPDSTLTVYLPNSEVPSAFFPIKFFYPKVNPEEKKDIASLFITMGPDAKGNDIVDFNYWLADKRKNYKVTNSWLNGKPIKIGLFDYDCNGLYNDSGSDRILIGNYEEDVIFDKLEKGAVEYSKGVQVSIAGEIYEVIEIEASGKYLSLIKSDKTYHKPLGIGDYVGDIKIELISGETTTLDALIDDKFLLLDFWGSWCKGCTQQLPELKNLAVNNSDKIQVIGLNYGDNMEAINGYISTYDIKWKNGIANEEIIKKLRIDGFPSYLLIDPKGKILIMHGRINEIEEQL